ncbi:DUF7601 domain-containing protein [Sharpea azabuensis]|uniref:DUF7601 domain-containing protein n=1 Tax=Sharpea azabuensis TaxID=322505 RepID=UPI00051C6DEF|nr:FctA domain-containing protein [Sharpea azabuensis]
MNKQLFRKSMTSFAVAGTMLFSAAAPAFAADTTTKDPLKPTFKKVVDVQDVDTYQPAETFKFTVKGVDPTENETRNGMKVSTGTGTITAKDVTTDTAKNGNQTYTSAFDLSQLTFTQPGIYKYEVKETSGTNKDMTYDVSTRYLYVFVKRENGNVKVYDSELVQDATKSDTFTNKYGVDNEFKDLTIKKEVTGVMGDTQKDWNFDLTLTSGSGRSTYVVKQGNETKTLTSGQTYEFTLKSGESIKVENLSTTDTYTVTEDESGQDNYVTTGEVKEAKNMADEDVTETITNKRDEVTPTGIMMMYGPYALMVALAGALGLFVAKKHRAEEE